MGRIKTHRCIARPTLRSVVGLAPAPVYAPARITAVRLRLALAGLTAIVAYGKAMLAMERTRHIWAPRLFTIAFIL